MGPEREPPRQVWGRHPKVSWVAAGFAFGSRFDRAAGSRGRSPGAVPGPPWPGPHPTPRSPGALECLSLGLIGWSVIGGGAPGMELHSQQRLRGRRPPGGAPAWPDPVLNPRPRGRGRKSLASCIEKVTLSGWWRGWGGLRTPVVGRLDRSPPSPQLLERVDGGATKAPVWPPSPLLSWVPVPSPPSSLLSPLLFTSLLQFCLFGTGVGGVGVLSSWDSRALIKESWRTVRPSPESSCLSRFIKSTTQGVSRDAGFVVIFHVINKDSFV